MYDDNKVKAQLGLSSDHIHVFFLETPGVFCLLHLVTVSLH